MKKHTDVSHQETHLILPTTSSCKKEMKSHSIMFKNYLVSCLKMHYIIMCAKNISDIHSDHLGIVCHAVPRGIKGNKEGKPGFQIYAYLVSYVLSTSTNMQLSSYKLAVVAITVCLIFNDV